MGDGSITRAHFARVAFSAITTGAVMGGTATVALAEEPASSIEEIVVTATKRATDLQLTPVSITALTGDFLDHLDIRDFNDYLDHVPGLAVIDMGPGQKRYLLRGVSNEDSNLSQSTVAQYIDEVPITNFGMEPDPRLVDVEQVEVSRGPQGTLFGARSMSGMIRTVTRKPVMDQVEGDAQATVSDTHFGGANGDVEGVINAPIVNDKLAVRVSGYYDYENGYVNQVFPGGTYVAMPNQLPMGARPPFPSLTLPPETNDHFSDTTLYGGRAAVRWTPNDAWTVDLMGLAQHMDVGAPPDFNIQASGNFSQGFISTADGYLGHNDTLTIGSATVNYQADWVEVTAVGAYARRNNFVLQASSPGGPLIGMGAGSTNNSGSDDKGYTTEVRLASRGTGPWHWLIGGYAYWRNSYAAMDQFSGFTNSSQIYFLSYEHAREQAGFGELSYDITGRLQVTGGFRYSWNDIYVDRYDIVPPPGVPVGPDPVIPSASDHAPTYKAELSFKATDDAFLYALAAEGYRPSGYNGNAIPGFNVIPFQFQPDTLWNYELGAKTKWMDGRLVVDGDVYRIDWNNIQVLGSTPTPLNPGPNPFTTNAGSAQIYGGELEVMAHVSTSFSIDASLNHFFKSTLTGSAPTEPSGLTPRAGDPLPYDPAWSFNLGGEYRRPISPGLNGFVRLDWSYVGHRDTGLQPFLDNGQPNPNWASFHSYNMVDLRLGLASGKWQTTAFVQNLFDAHPIIMEQNFAPAPVVLATTRTPRTVGITVRRNF